MNTSQEVPPQCKKCVLCHSPPDIWLDEGGICNICNEFEKTKNDTDCQMDFLESDLIKQLTRFKKKKKYKITVISPHWFLRKTTDQYVEEITRDLDWKYPRHSYPAKSTNCYLNFLSVHLSMKNYGYTHYHVEMSKMIRMGMMTRGEALELLEINFDDQMLEMVLGRMGCSLEQIR